MLTADDGVYSLGAADSGVDDIVGGAFADDAVGVDDTVVGAFAGDGAGDGAAK